MTRCIDCDKSFTGSFDEHCKTEEHDLNETVNYILRIMKQADIDIDTLYSVIKKRPEGSHYGEILGPVGKYG